MQSATFTAAFAAFAFLAGSAAAAPAFQAQARLATPASAPIAATAGEASWRCDGDACTGDFAHKTLDNPVRECRKAAAVLGPLAAYESHGFRLEAGDLRACNVAAKSSGSAVGAAK